MSHDAESDSDLESDDVAPDSDLESVLQDCQPQESVSQDSTEAEQPQTCPVPLEQTGNFAHTPQVLDAYGVKQSNNP